ncbi:MAG TPA: CcmD family protein [Vicinamibacterales bacterium]
MRKLTIPLRRLACLLLAAGCLAASPAVTPVAALQPQAAQDEYVPLSEIPPGEQLPAQPLLFAAYGFVWVAVLVYVWLLWRRLGAVQRDLETLRHAPRE